MQQDLKLEVVDWGGIGSPLVFLIGLGNNAHIFGNLAPRFTAQHHVYDITRRGFGTSSVPPPSIENYTADRLGDVVLAVMHSLQIDRPVLTGHSIAGEELSSIGSRYPEKISDLVYLDAGNPYVFYDKGRGNANLDALALKTEIDELISGPNPRPGMAEMLKQLPLLENELNQQQEEIPALPFLPAPPPNALKARKGIYTSNTPWRATIHQHSGHDPRDLCRSARPGISLGL